MYYRHVFIAGEFNGDWGTRCTVFTLLTDAKFVTTNYDAIDIAS